MSRVFIPGLGWQVSTELELGLSELVIEKPLVVLNKPVELKSEPSLLMCLELGAVLGDIHVNPATLPIVQCALRAVYSKTYKEIINI